MGKGGRGRGKEVNDDRDSNPRSGKGGRWRKGSGGYGKDGPGVGRRFVKGSKGKGKGRGRLGVIRTIDRGPQRWSRFKGARKGKGKGKNGKGPPPLALTNGEVGKKLFFANVPFDIRTKDLRSVFEEAGEVERVFVFDDFRGQPRGMGLVSYTSARGADTALEKLSGRLIGDRELYLQEDTSQYNSMPSSGRSMRPQMMADGDASNGRGTGPSPYAMGRTIFFANVLFNTPATTLIRHFEKVGLLSKFTLFTLPDGRSRGMGIAEYRRVEDAEAAYTELHDTRVDGRPLLVDQYTPMGVGY